MGKKKADALKRREAELLAELERRNKKAKKAEREHFAKLDAKGEKKAKGKAPKKGKKGKAEKPAKVEAPTLSEVEAAAIADAKAERAAARESAKAKTANAAAKVLADEGASPSARAAAETAASAADEASDDETDEQIRARVLAKRAAREAAGMGITSTVEKLDALAEGRAPKPETVAKVEDAVEALKAEVTQLETETGRIFEAGAGPEALGHSDDGFERVALPGDAVMPDLADDFAKPSEAPKGDFETNGNNQYKVKRPSDGRVVGYTRATTYIANLEDRSMLEKWKLRLVLEGVGVHDVPSGADGAVPEPVAARMADLIHRRDVAIAKARKADRKGKLVTGQLATIVDGAWSEFKKAVNALAEELLDLGGANEKSQKGTDLHALMELYDREGIDAVGDLLTEGKISPADLADVEAYAAAMKAAGIKVDLIEQTIVNDELKVGGRLDRTALVKLPGMARSTRCVVDIKTGASIELGAGKLAQQLEMYASSQAYVLDTDERFDMKLSRTKGIVVHVPQGTGTAKIHVVDLVLGRKGNKLSGEVRAWRNEGKRAVDFKVDLARPETFSMIE